MRFPSLLNYRDHPVQKDYTVFFFSNFHMSAHFEQRLVEDGIPYERAVEDNGYKRYLFGVHKKYMNRTLAINEEAMREHSKKFIPVASLRYTLLAVIFSLIVIALIGYLRAHG